MPRRRPSPRSDAGHDPVAGDDALLRALLARSVYPPDVQIRLLEADLAEVHIIDGEPTLVVDPIFERARGAVLAGLDDADRHRPDPAARDDVIDLTDHRAARRPEDPDQP